MEKLPEAEKFSFHILKPTEKEIAESAERAKKKFGIVISRVDAIEFAKLTQELKFWLTVEKSSKSPECITEEMAKEYKEYKDMISKNGKEITLKDAYIESKKALLFTMSREKERIANEISAIVSRY